ncbi:MAG: dipeptide epimerase [Bifidobacteriaceae bacterium]|jgi:L-alanine-DL-glutamate epimerase-like enolase superfamily enzyme|nr:dipeptide epimerase [Bifidobacteriaceae bacterium]
MPARVSRVTARRVALPLPAPFVISLGVLERVDNVFVRLETDDGLVGYGEAAPTPFVTGETPAGTLAAVEALAPLIEGLSPFAIGQAHRLMDRVLAGNGSAKAAIDIAMHDVAAQAAGVPLYEYLGGPAGGADPAGAVETDMTIGLGEPEAMAAAAAELVRRGYRQLKVKAGSCEAQDRAAIELIRAAAPRASLKVDANQGWTPPRALAMLEGYARLGVEAVEQPVPAWDLDGLAYVRSRSPIPIMADESCFTQHDAAGIVARQAADIINIKLMKCGGLWRARQINAIAQGAGVRTMLGCMLETELAIAAAAHLAAASANIAYADLDSFADFDTSPVIARPFGFEPPVIQLGGPGLGLEVAW